jgi:hypothetical protein
MYGSVVDDFNQLMGQLNAEMNSPEAAGDDEAMGGIFTSYGRTRASRKFRIAMALRQQIALTLAEHAPDQAYNFFYGSLASVSNPQLREEMESSDKYFEAKLLEQIAETDATMANEYARESLKKGLNDSHLDILKKIYDKDAEKGIEFGAAVLSRLKGDRKKEIDTSIYSRMLSFGGETLEASKREGGKKPVYTMAELRDIAELLAQVILDQPDEAVYLVEHLAYVIEPYAPSRAAQIRAKYKSSLSQVATANTNSAYPNYGGLSTNANSSAAVPDRRKEDRDAREKAGAKLMEDLKDLASKPLSKEDRDKVVAQARKIIAQTPGKDKKILALNLLAAQVARSGDKELAADIMRDAEGLITAQPKNYQDFLYTLMVAAGYAEADPAKAFPILADTIARINDTIAAAVKVAEFMDTTDEMVQDGEVQVGMFGGSMVRGLTNDLGIANMTIRSLVKADFAKTRELTNSFERTEVRVLAKMMVLRAVLDEGKQPGSPETVPPDEMGAAHPAVSRGSYPSAIGRRQQPVLRH